MPSGDPSVTIYADASFHPATGKGGWACMVRVRGRPDLWRHGPLKSGPGSSNTAEVMALANGLSIAKREGLLQLRATVIFRSDSLKALAAIRDHTMATETHDRQDLHRHGGLPPTPKLRPALDLIAKIVLDLELSVEVRHMKGHAKRQEGAAINRRCDMLAKEGRLLA
jgi:ribonuclease HI